MVEYIVCEAAYDMDTLYDWYISSVSENDNPVWTEEHLEELLNDFYVIPKDTPTADVAPVRHVTNRAKYFGETLCPNCGIHLDETTIISKDENEDGDIIHYEFQPNFCANCGARMDGDKNDP